MTNAEVRSKKRFDTTTYYYISTIFSFKLIMQWLNEPPSWQVKDSTIRVTSTQDTDFWRITHYGFIRDSGHFYYRQVTGDFVASVKVTGEYRDLYDQAGLMVRLDEENWLKCGIEFVAGVQQLSAVVTRDYSDWSIAPTLDNPTAIWLRVTCKNSAIEVHYSLDGGEYQLLRMTYLTESKTLDVGIMCASPEGKGFTTVFEQLKIG